MKRWSYLENGFFGAFLFWGAAGLIFIVLRITPAVVAHWQVPDWLVRFVDICLQTGDPILILLAFANSHLNAARQWSPAIARRWGMMILVCAYTVETLGARTGFPFGVYTYTKHFGPLLGTVPLVIPLAWYVVVTNALFVVRIVSPYLPKLGEVAVVALICTAYDFILEPFATAVKSYWIWKGDVIPWQNYAAWFVLSGLLVWFFAPTNETRFRYDPRPWVLLGLMITIFLAGVVV